MKRAEALQPLSHDHYEGLRFAARLRAARRAGEAAGDWAASVAAFWRDHLIPHFAEEEVLVLPILQAGAPPLAARIRAEHRAIETLVAAVEAEPPSWDGRLGGFADVLTAHIRFEEREAFPAAERLAEAGAQDDPR